MVHKVSQSELDGDSLPTLSFISSCTAFNLRSLGATGEGMDLVIVP